MSLRIKSPEHIIHCPERVSIRGNSYDQPCPYTCETWAKMDKHLLSRHGRGIEFRRKARMEKGLKGLKGPELKVRHVINNSEGRDVPYQFMGTELQMPDHDFDIKLIQPDGSALLVQWRIENSTVDVCLIKAGNEEEPETKIVYVSDANLKEVKRRKKGGYPAQQITIM